MKNQRENEKSLVKEEEKPYLLDCITISHVRIEINLFTVSITIKLQKNTTICRYL